MRNMPKWKGILFILVILAVYCTALVLGATEWIRRSLYLTSEAGASDRVLVTVRVTGVDPTARELRTQLTFRVMGNLAKDEVTPASDLRLFVNSIRGQQDFEFPKGKRMNLIEAVFPLDGNVNRYPFDKYEGSLWFLITKRSLKEQTQISIPEQSGEEPSPPGTPAVGVITFQQSAPVPVSIAISASIPGMKFTGDVTRSEAQLTGVELNLRRANSLILVSMLLNAMMLGLATSVLIIVLKQLRTVGIDAALVPLSLAFALIFGLPALRNTQPGVPPVGVFSDWISFIWAELIVGASALICAWEWLTEER
jgi:Domain of unknown function (DUF4436)